MNQPEVVSKGLPEPRMPFQPLSKFCVGPVANMAVLAGLASALVFLFLLDPWQDPPAEAGPGLQGSVPRSESEYWLTSLPGQATIDRRQ